MILALLLACAPVDPGAGPALARFTVEGWDGEALDAEATLHAAPKGEGFASVLRLTGDGPTLEERVVLETDAAGWRAWTGLRRVGRGWEEQRAEAVGAGWRRRWRRGLAVGEDGGDARPPLLSEAAAMPGAAGLGASLAVAAWMSARPQPGRGPALRLPDGVVVEADWEARERATLSLDGAPVAATRDFLRTPSAGLTLWRADDGGLLALVAPDGLRLVREGLSLPAAAPPPPPPGVVEEDFSLTRPDVVLAGTLTAPEGGEAPAGTVVLLHGSGPGDRDGDYGPVRPGLFRDLARALAARGFRVVRYDKRGVGGSVSPDGEPPDPRMEALVDDAGALLDAWGGGCAFVVGHSEGGVLAPALANRRDDVRGVVLLAGPAGGLGDVLEAQLDLITAAHAVPEARREAASLAQRATLELMQRPSPDPEAEEPSLAWLRSHFAHDAEGELAALRVPTLALFGGLDLQVPPDQAPLLSQRVGPAATLTVAVLPGLDHLLMPAEPPGGMGAYADPDRRVPAEVFERVADWLAARSCAAPPPSGR